MTAERIHSNELDVRFRVAQVMRQSDEVVHLDHTLDEAAGRMRRHALTLLPVVDGDELVGVLSADSIANAKLGSSELPLTVSDRMARDFAFCYDHDDVSTAKALMEEGELDNLIVVDIEGQPVGVVSAGDVAGMVADKAALGRLRRTGSAGRAKGNPPGAPGNYEMKPKLKR